MEFEQLKQGATCPWLSDLTVHLISQEDLPDICTMLEDPAVTEFLYFAPAPEELYREYFGAIIKATQDAIEREEWAEKISFILRDQAGQFMGIFSLTRAMFLDGNFEVAYMLPQYAWGRGIATTACAFLTRLAFSELGAHKVAADCYAGNVSSYTVLEKSGYKLEGRQEAYYKLEAGYSDKLLYGLTIEQYKNLVR